MPWLDPARANESDEDKALREDLRQLMGVPAPTFFEAKATPALVALAESLRKEADRRRHTLRPRPAWMLMAAAALPFILVMGAVGAWGVNQKRRADGLNQAVAQREAELRQRAAVPAVQPAPSRELRPDLAQVAENRPAAARKPARAMGQELVLPVERSLVTLPREIQTVKGHSAPQPVPDPAPQADPVR